MRICQAATCGSMSVTAVACLMRRTWMATPACLRADDMYTRGGPSITLQWRPTHVGTSIERKGLPGVAPMRTGAILVER